MNEKAWTLEEIRKAYREILRAWNVLFPIYPDGRRGEEIILDAFDTDGDDFYRKTFFKKMEEVSPRLRTAADQSGNAKVWHTGESVDGLSQGMKERVERALRFGI